MLSSFNMEAIGDNRSIYYVVYTSKILTVFRSPCFIYSSIELSKKIATGLILVANQ